MRLDHGCACLQILLAQPLLELGATTTAVAPVRLARLGWIWGAWSSAGFKFQTCVIGMPLGMEYQINKEKHWRRKRNVSCFGRMRFWQSNLLDRSSRLSIAILPVLPLFPCYTSLGNVLPSCKALMHSRTPNHQSCTWSGTWKFDILIYAAHEAAELGKDVKQESNAELNLGSCQSVDRIIGSFLQSFWF